jgi:hypothetical protein
MDCLRALDGRHPRRRAEPVTPIGVRRAIRTPTAQAKAGFPPRSLTFGWSSPRSFSSPWLHARAAGKEDRSRVRPNVETSRLRRPASMTPGPAASMHRPSTARNVVHAPAAGATRAASSSWASPPGRISTLATAPSTPDHPTSAKARTLCGVGRSCPSARTHFSTGERTTRGGAVALRIPRPSTSRAPGLSM